MLLEIKVPEAGFSITEGTVIEWYKGEGDPVSQGETIVAIETEKLSVDIPAEQSGVLKRINHQAGETVPVGGVLGTIETEAGVDSGAEKRSPEPAGGSGAVQQGPEPELSELLETTSQAPSAGAFGNSGAGAPVTETAVPSRQASSAGRTGKIKASPLAKAVARERGVDLSLIEGGSGPHGRIVKDDVLRFLQQAPAKGRGPAPASTEAAPASPGPAAATVPGQGAVPGQGSGETAQAAFRAETAGEGKAAAWKPAEYGKRQQFTGWRKVIAERMTASVREVPHYTMNVEIDVTSAAGLISETRQQNGTRLTFLHLVMKAVALGAAAYPQVNAFCWSDGYELREEVNVGIAVDLGEKLLVPVVKDVHSSSITEIAGNTKLLVDKARADRLEPADIEGGTITITNVGVYNIHSGTSIIMQPQTTILYIGAVREVPAVHEGSIEIRKKMLLGGTFDHRLVHGGPGARFLDLVKSNLENLNTMLLNLR